MGSAVGPRCLRAHPYTHTHILLATPPPKNDHHHQQQQASYITWGVVQERVMTKAYGEGDGAEFFPSSAVRLDIIDDDLTKAPCV